MPAGEAAGKLGGVGEHHRGRQRAGAGAPGPRSAPACPPPSTTAHTEPGAGRYRGLRGGGAVCDGAADAPGGGRARGVDDVPASPVHRHVSGVRDRPGCRRHPDALVDLRRSGHSGRHPGRWLRDHDAGIPAGAAGLPASGPVVAVVDHLGDQGRGARRCPTGPGGRGAHDADSRGGRGHGPDDALLVGIRPRPRDGGLPRRLPRRLGVQQRRLLALQRQPARLHHRPLRLPPHRARRDPGRPRLPGPVRAATGADHPQDVVTAHQDHAAHLRHAPGGRHVVDHRLRVDQSRHARTAELAGQAARRVLPGRGAATHRWVQLTRLRRDGACQPARHRRADVHRWRQCQHCRRHQGHHFHDLVLRHRG